VTKVLPNKSSSYLKKYSCKNSKLTNDSVKTTEKVKTVTLYYNFKQLIYFILI